MNEWLKYKDNLYDERVVKRSEGDRVFRSRKRVRGERVSSQKK